MQRFAQTHLKLAPLGSLARDPPDEHVLFLLVVTAEERPTALEPVGRLLGAAF
jgi:hypothetical protein